MTLGLSRGRPPEPLGPGWQLAVPTGSFFAPTRFYSPFPRTHRPEATARHNNSRARRREYPPLVSQFSPKNRILNLAARTIAIQITHSSSAEAANHQTEATIVSPQRGSGLSRARSALASAVRRRE